MYLSPDKSRLFPVVGEKLYTVERDYVESNKRFPQVREELLVCEATVTDVTPGALGSSTIRMEVEVNGKRKVVMCRAVDIGRTVFQTYNEAVRYAEKKADKHDESRINRTFGYPILRGWEMEDR